ncbi:Exodeoxyribonuclease 7 small subunit [Luteitalea pratensis]|uniref:Exodeoxyribonuclease 7 small subunit n=1 Tax=Luteitalea pratensis TaxID=1855912 RepID=A0A143PN47_LUTPR|nr:exodeoxyribonuclease VII small subunit [Luteitalea pratensis]AMY09643.1 Exodeoxyribonuclease 7 small subunit [Luteitalea pratensis]
MTDPTDFEQALTELDAIVRSLEQGDQPLEQSLALFERGVTLSRFCHEKLTDAEKRIQVLTQSGGLRDETAAFEKDLSPRQSDRG